MKTYNITVLFCLISGISLLANTPEKVVSEYFQKLKAEGMGGTGKFIHPDELNKFREMAEPVVKRALSNSDTQKFFSVFSDSEDSKEVKKMNGVEFMNAFMKMLEGPQSLTSLAMKNSEYTVLGHIKEKDISHVVVRIKMSTNNVEKERLGVLSVKDHNGVPMMMLDSEIKDLLESMQKTSF